MDFTPNADQEAILAAVGALLAQHAGPARAVELAGKGDVDIALARALDAAGFLDLATGDDTGLIEASLLVEAVAARGGVGSVAAEALVAAPLCDARPPGPIALADARDLDAPLRYGAHARTLLVADGAHARCVALEPGDCEPVRSSFGYPMGRLRPGAVAAGERLADGSGPRMRQLWQLALAAEAAGLMRAALDQTVEYLKQRRQFGRPIGSFQAVQHRLAECHVWVEGAAWLAREAAHHGAPAAEVATACAHALTAAGRVFAETHQLSGAIGYTREHDLHVFSMRLQALRLELGGVAAQRRAAARARWTPAP